MSGILHVEDDSQQIVSGDGLPAHNGDPIIKVIGIGGGGGSTIQHMIDEKVTGVEFIAVNTDLQALNSNSAEKRIQIGVNTTRGLGSGSNPSVGCKAAEESEEDLIANIGQSDIVFLTAGMGGGTGTGATPVIARIAQEKLHALTIAIVTIPFSFEGKKQMKKALEGIENLRDAVDALIIVPNDKLLLTQKGNISLLDAFQICNKVLMRAVVGVSSVIRENGFINIDFNDFKTVLQKSGNALIGMGSAEGENAVERALNEAIKSPLLDDVSGCKVRGAIVNISVDHSFDLTAYQYIGNKIEEYFSDDTDVKIGVTFNANDSAEEVCVTVVLAGIVRDESIVAEQTQAPEPVVEDIVNEAPTKSIFGGGFTRVEENESDLSVPPINPQQSQPNNMQKAATKMKITLPSFLQKKSSK